MKPVAARVAGTVFLTVWALVLLIDGLRRTDLLGGSRPLAEGHLWTHWMVPAAFAIVGAALLVADIDHSGRRPPLGVVYAVAAVATATATAQAFLLWLGGSGRAFSWFGRWGWVPVILTAMIAWRDSARRRALDDDEEDDGRARPVSRQRPKK